MVQRVETFPTDVVTAPRPFAERVPLDAISAEARKARPGRALAALIGGLLFNIEWSTAKVFQVLIYAGAWSFSA